MQLGNSQGKGRIASLHLHPATPGSPMPPCSLFHLLEGMGIQEDVRYFARKQRATGKPTVRQVSLIEREVIAQHAAALGLDVIEPGRVRSNVETEGIDLIALVGSYAQIGDAILRVCEPRTPCAKMDAIHPGLRARMGYGQQGVLAQVVRSGEVRPGDLIVTRPDFS